MLRHDVQVLPMLGTFIGNKGPVDVRWPQIERLVVNNREVAKIKSQPGAAIQLYPHIAATESEKAAITAKLMEVKGQAPAAIYTPNVLFEIMDQGEEVEAEDE